MSYVSACPQCIKHLARIAELEAALLDVPDSWAQEKKELEAKLAKAQRQITHDGETLLKLGSELAYQKSRWNPASEQLTALEKRAGQAEAKLAEAENLVRVEIVRRGIAEVEVERLSEQLRLCTVPDGWETWRHQAEADLARLVGAVERVINYAVDLHGSYNIYDGDFDNLRAALAAVKEESPEPVPRCANCGQTPEDHGRDFCGSEP